MSFIIRSNNVFIQLYFNYKISYELKWRYLKAVLSQDWAWYEAQNIEELPTQINVNVTEVENATGKTIGIIIYSVGAFIVGIGWSFFIGAVLACCYLVNLPYILIWGMSRGKLLSKENEEIEKSYEKSGADAEQALMSIRVVKAFGQEVSEIQKYTKHLSQADKRIHKYSVLFGLSWGMIDSMIYVTQSYALMIGGFFIAGGVTNGNVDRTYNLADTFGASMSITMGAMYIGSSAMNIQVLRRGLACAGSIISIIDRVPQINIYDESAENIQAIDDDITFENVSFKYEGRNKTILDDVSLCFKSGKTTALVGPSGWGKSTIVRLLERFYDPTEGKVLVGDKDLKCINLQHYRRKIGYVGQEPCLLNESIKNNLLNANPDATDEEIIDCLKLAQAYDFVLKLPNGINTDVGGVGNKLSGGQKQRIAIARALIKKPDLLILDEATSALDSENERAVQSAIDNVKKTHVITTVVVAHRLTTIQNADLIQIIYIIFMNLKII